MHSRVNDLQINANLALMGALYIAGFVLIVAACLGHIATAWAILGHGFVAIAAVRTIAGWFCQLERHQDAAFQLGRDAAFYAEVRQLGSEP